MGKPNNQVIRREQKKIHKGVQENPDEDRTMVQKRLRPQRVQRGKKEHRTRYKGVPTDKKKGLIPMATEPKHFLSKSAVGRSDR